MRNRDHRPFMQAIAAEARARGTERVLGGQHSYALLWAAWT
eukprot:CAMPEP_0171122722 /NCGR_PEP_ID=MMETSP0766_2-20121228/105627_1 /TAXON_ID=439317 /ORGANISM="Gambierdiscus australes, Strain CAWD 149" /LENGTH=40 /DNA_ID= /DNA_START= /DNA_END= /DNA_ORIENTATION=